MTEKENNTKLIVFVDCVGDDEVNQTDFINKHYQGKIKSGIPRVTPRIVTSMLTGGNPAQHGLLSPLRLKEPNIFRPLTKTVIEEAGEEHRTLNYEIPMTMNLQAKYLMNVGSSIGGAQGMRPGYLNFPSSPGQMWLDEPSDLFKQHRDRLQAIFGSFRNIIRQDIYDLIFLSIRNMDTFGHYLFKPERKALLKYIDNELSLFGEMEDVDLMFFSDHGIVPKKETFYINKWLMDKGYLNVKIFEEAVKKKDEGEKKEFEQKGIDAEPLKSLSIFDQLVVIEDETQAVSTDVFDSGVKVMDKSIIEDLRADLMDTGMFDGIYTPEELWGQHKFTDKLGLDLVCDRGDGVLVPGNIHPDITTPFNPDVWSECNIRNGVHSRFGIWGTDDHEIISRRGKRGYSPEDFYQVIRQMSMASPEVKSSQIYGFDIDTDENVPHLADKDEKIIRERLEKLGYL